jgi:PHP family Zn ribbon phosphoesterase
MNAGMRIESSRAGQILVDKGETGEYGRFSWKQNHTFAVQ